MRCIESTTTYRSSLERVDLSYVACTGTCTCTCTCSVENEQLSVVSYSLWRIWLSESQSKFLHIPSSLSHLIGIHNVFRWHVMETSFADFKSLSVSFVYVFRSWDVLSDGRSFWAVKLTGWRYRALALWLPPLVPRIQQQPCRHTAYQLIERTFNLPAF